MCVPMALTSELFSVHIPNEIEVSIRVMLSLILGACVGLERQWRAGLAGMRTNALVAVGAALFVVMGAYGFSPDGSADPTRVAAQVVSGVGFLGAGVMIREGLNVRGLNTAATIWSSAAVGCLAGVGLYIIALLGTAIIVVANMLLRPLGRAVTRRSHHVTKKNSTPPPVGLSFEVVTSEKAEPRVRALLMQVLSRPQHSLRGITASHDDKHGGAVLITAELNATEVNVDVLERAITRVSLDPKVSSARWWRADNSSDENDDY